MICNNRIRILSHNKLLYYDISGNYIYDISLSFIAQNFTKINSSYDAYYGDSKEDRIILANKNGRKIYSYFEYTPRNRLTTPWFIQKTDSIILFNIPLCDTIYKITKDIIYPYCKINFGRSSFSQKCYRNLSPNNRQNAANYIIESKNYALKNFYSETVDYKILTFAYNKKHICCIQAKKNENKKLFYDLLTCKDDIWFSRVYALPIKIMSNNRLIFVQEYPAEIIYGQEFLKNKVKSKNISEIEKMRLNTLNLFCKKINELSNPVLIIAKIKADKFK